MTDLEKMLVIFPLFYVKNDFFIHYIWLIEKFNGYLHR